MREIISPNHHAVPSLADTARRFQLSVFQQLFFEVGGRFGNEGEVEGAQVRGRKRVLNSVGRFCFTPEEAPCRPPRKFSAALTRTPAPRPSQTALKCFLRNLRVRSVTQGEPRRPVQASHQTQRIAFQVNLYVKYENHFRNGSASYSGLSALEIYFTIFLCSYTRGDGEYHEIHCTLLTYESVSNPRTPFHSCVSRYRESCKSSPR